MSAIFEIESEKNLIYKVKPSIIEGEITVSGAKNSALRLLAASILTDEKVHLLNYPDQLRDAVIHVEMLKMLGKVCNVERGQIVVSQESDLDKKLIWEHRSIRNTLLILGGLLAKYGEGAVPLPGGCKIGERKYDFHINIFKKLGADVWEDEEYLYAKSKGRLKGGTIDLPLRSTGATENTLICGSLARGITTLLNPHLTPEVEDLIDFLRKGGVKIEVFGQEKILIHGVEGLNGIQHTVLPDRMEAFSWLVASTVTGGELHIKNFPHKTMEVALHFLEYSGLKLFRHDSEVIVKGGKCYPFEISTGAHPAIHSDIQPLFAVYGANANGLSKIIEHRYPERFAYAEDFRAMGVDTQVKGNELFIQGGSKIKGTTVNAHDLRAGIALVFLACTAEAGSETIIQNAWQVERGYNNIVSKLLDTGVAIEAIN
jgi:UDP-N-acetylglucosamine 1-carboxyvinyltransferase